MGDVRSVGQKYRVWRKENSDQRELVYNMGLHFFIAFSSQEFTMYGIDETA
jgi:hypothetical protein